MISIYNATEPPPGPRNLAQLIGKNIRMEGFIVSHHFDMMPAFLDDLAGWVRDGKVTWKETVFEGIEKAPEAFLGLFKGENLGKMLVKLA
jgi:NADPH-dependent curcumin reductase CurA